MCMVALLLFPVIWQLHILCREICKIILAPTVARAWLPYLELKIAEHHNVLSKIAPSLFIPKIHFVTHYPRLMLEFGPLRHLWVMRFEATHQYLKQIVRRIKNFKNITATLAARFQAKKCYELTANALMLSNTVIPCSRKNVTIENVPEDLVHVINQQLCDNTC